MEEKEYGQTPSAFVSRFGIPRQEWDRVGTVFVLRSCLVTPFLERETTFDAYWEDFRSGIEKTLSQL